MYISLKTIGHEYLPKFFHVLIFNLDNLLKPFANGKPKTISYRCFKNFDQKKFNDELKKRISVDPSFEAFLEIFQFTLHRFAPYKQKKYGIVTILS